MVISEEAWRKKQLKREYKQKKKTRNQEGKEKGP
jgi:hypothetical protein